MCIDVEMMLMVDLVDLPVTDVKDWIAVATDSESTSMFHKVIHISHCNLTHA
jgi:hypothetical protein